jgi:methylaspartate ammonia-lyase
VTVIRRVLAVPAVGAGYYEDLAALQADPIPLPLRFTAPPVTTGFRAVREVAEAVSVGLELDDGCVAWGDCVAVSYSGRGGREPVFRSEEGLHSIQTTVVPFLKGQPVASFRELATKIDSLTETVEVTRPITPPEPASGKGVSRRALLSAPARVWQAARGERDMPTEQVLTERRLHTAVRYGVSQALLQAVARARGVTMAEVITEEWDLPLPEAPIPIHAQSGSERAYHAEKMIVHRIASLPHGLADDLPKQLGRDGSEMTHYLQWLSRRIAELGGEEYQPTIHLDLQGALGRIYDNQLGRVLGQLYSWQLAAQPYPLRIECPVLLESREAQIEAMKTLRDYIRLRKMSIQIVADEWANTVEDIRAFLDAGAADMIQIKMPDLGSIHNAVEASLACQDAGAAAFLGGSYAETDLSARASVHVALACRSDLIMAKPGLEVDGAISLVQNEMARALAQVREARSQAQDLDSP